MLAYGMAGTRTPRDISPPRGGGDNSEKKFAQLGAYGPPTPPMFEDRFVWI